MLIRPNREMNRNHHNSARGQHWNVGKQNGQYDLTEQCKTSRRLTKTHDSVNSDNPRTPTPTSQSAASNRITRPWQQDTWPWQPPITDSLTGHVVTKYTCLLHLAEHKSVVWHAGVRESDEACVRFRILASLERTPQSTGHEPTEIG